MRTSPAKFLSPLGKHTDVIDPIVYTANTRTCFNLHGRTRSLLLNNGASGSRASYSISHKLIYRSPGFYLYLKAYHLPLYAHATNAQHIARPDVFYVRHLRNRRSRSNATIRYGFDAFIYFEAPLASSSVESSLSGPNDMGSNCSRVMTVYLPSLSYIKMGVLGYYTVVSLGPIV